MKTRVGISIELVGNTTNIYNRYKTLYTLLYPSVNHSSHAYYNDTNEYILCYTRIGYNDYYETTAYTAITLDGAACY